MSKIDKDSIMLYENRFRAIGCSHTSTEIDLPTLLMANPERSVRQKALPYKLAGENSIVWRQPTILGDGPPLRHELHLTALLPPPDFEGYFIINRSEAALLMRSMQVGL